MKKLSHLFFVSLLLFASAAFAGTPLLDNSPTIMNNVVTTTGDSGAKTATFNGATQTNVNGTGAIITVTCGTVSGSTPTMNMQLQWSPDGAGGTWLNVGAATSNLTATNNTATIIVYPTNSTQAAGTTPITLTTGSTTTLAINMALPRVWRLVYTLGAASGTPSFAITAVYVDYLK